MTWGWIALCAFLLGVTATAAVIAAVARRAVNVRPSALIDIMQPSDDLVEMNATSLTEAPGTYGLFLEDGRHIRVGPIRSIDHARRRVTRELESGGQLGCSRGRWSGTISVDPKEFGLDLEVQVDTEQGPAPAWTSSAPNTRWAVHIHGRGSSRAGVLRSVPAATKLGYRSLVISFRGTPEGPLRGEATVLSLGQEESRDLDSALDYIASQGGTDVVLFGWSMGASMALLSAERSSQRDLIRGLVLVDPAVEWRGLLRRGAQRAGLPALCGHLASQLLATRVGSRLLGLDRPIDFDLLDWTRTPRVERPMLVIHSSGDLDVPVELSRAFVALSSLRALAEFDAVPHCAEYNAFPDQFNETIERWHRKRVIYRPL